MSKYSRSWSSMRGKVFLAPLDGRDCSRLLRVNARSSLYSLFLHFVAGFERSPTLLIVTTA